MKLPNIDDQVGFDRHFQGDEWHIAAREICKRHEFHFAELSRIPSSDHIVFSIDNKFVLKIYRPFRNCFDREKNAIEFILGRTSFKTPEIVEVGEIESFQYIVMTKLPGNSFTRKEWLALPTEKQLNFVSKLAVAIKEIHELKATEFQDDWSKFVRDRAETFVERQIAHGVNQQILEVLPKFIEENLPLVPVNSSNVFMHSDIHFGNLRVAKTNGNWEIAGLFDFADSRRGFYEYDFLAVGVLMIQGQREVQREFFRAYGYSESDLDETMRRRLMMLTMLYETADLRRYALRLKPEAVNFTLEELEREIWSFV